VSGVFSALGLETALLSRRFRLFALAALIGGVLVALATAFLSFAAYLSLLDYLPPWLAALAVAGGALALGVILLAVAIKALGRAADQVQVAVKSNALVRAAPLAAQLATRNPRLIAGLAAVAAAGFALIRALGDEPKPKP
jgi:hypothetical protein